MIKVVVGYIDENAFDSVRSELAELEIMSWSVAAAGGVGGEKFAAPHFRGSPMATELVGKLRIECVTAAEQIDAVKDAILGHGNHSFVYVMNVESATPEELVKGA